MKKLISKLNPDSFLPPVTLHCLIGRTVVDAVHGCDSNSYPILSIMLDNGDLVEVKELGQVGEIFVAHYPSGDPRADEFSAPSDPVIPPPMKKIFVIQKEEAGILSEPRVLICDQGEAQREFEITAREWGIWQEPSESDREWSQRITPFDPDGLTVLHYYDQTLRMWGVTEMRSR